MYHKVTILMDSQTINYILGNKENNFISQKE